MDQVVAVAALSLLALLFLWFKISKPEHNYPDGPRGLPVLGNLFDLKRLQASPDGELKTLAQRWGEMCMLWVGPQPVLIVNSPRIVKILLNERSAIYSSRPPRNRFRQMIWPWRLMAEPSGSDFKLIRKLYHSYLGPSQSLLFRPYQDYESRVMMNTLLDKPDSFFSAVEKYTMSVTFSVVHGCRLDALNHPILVEFMNLWNVVMQYIQPGTLWIDYLPSLQYLPLYFQPLLKKIQRKVKREMQLHLGFLKTLQESNKAQTAPDCFGRDLINAQEDQDISDEKATHILSMLIGAGSDTSASILQSFFKIVALNPEAAKKAQDELDSVIGPDRLPAFSDEPNLPYVRSFIKEQHRWSPIGSLSIPHCALKDDVFEGYFIPKGTIVYPNLAGLSHDPDQYKDSETFNPDRYAGDESTAHESAQSKDFTKRDHFHYGFGRRLCPGIHVAEASLFINMSRVLWGFDISEKKDEKLSMKDKYQALIWKPYEYRVCISSRGPQYAATMREALKQAHTDALNFDDVMKHIQEEPN